RKKIIAYIISRENGIVAGVSYAKEIFASKNCRVLVHRRDGQTVSPNQKILTITGDTYSVLSRERTALNLMSRMSGIATQTNTYVKKIRAANPKVGLYSTRKTAPGLRIFDKEAVEIGGGHKHRMSLDQTVMIKDNHIAASEGVEIILLDNMSPPIIKKVISELKRLNLRNKVRIEASGGINHSNVAQYAKSGVDMI